MVMVLYHWFYTDEFRSVKMILVAAMTTPLTGLLDYRKAHGGCLPDMPDELPRVKEVST